MVEEAEQAGLNVCEVRLLYCDNKSSTPTKDQVCAADSLDCWDGSYKDPADIIGKLVPKFSAMLDENGEVRSTSPIYFRCQGAWDIPDEDVSITSSQQPDSLRDSDIEMELDTSYGGHWARAEASPPSLSSPSPYLDFGISVFDQTNSQVVTNPIKLKGPKDPRNKGKELEVQTMLGKDESKDFKKDESKDFKSDEFEIQTMLLNPFEIQQ